MNPGDVGVAGISGGNYGPVTVSGSGITNIVLALAKAISGPDRVTVPIGNAQINIFTRRLKSCRATSTTTALSTDQRRPNPEQRNPGPRLPGDL